MSQKIFAIMGATGHIGHVIVDDLLKRGHIVRALGRDEKKLHQLLIKGAEIFISDFDDVDILSDLFKDTYAVFSMIPPSYNEKNFSDYQDRVSQAIFKALQNTNVKRVINLSSIGANLEDGTGPIKGLHAHEKRLDTLQNLTTLIHLRPGYFMENLNSYIPMILDQGIFSSCLSKDIEILMVATRDIGWKAADFLDSSAPLSKLIFEFAGPKPVTMQHVAEVFGKAFDQPDLQYQQISYEEEKQRMLSMGMTEDFANLMIEMYTGFNNGLIQFTQELKTTHHGTTSLEEYVQMLAHRTLVHAKR